MGPLIGINNQYRYRNVILLFMEMTCIMLQHNVLIINWYILTIIISTIHLSPDIQYIKTRLRMTTVLHGLNSCEVLYRKPLDLDSDNTFDKQNGLPFENLNLDTISVFGNVTLSIPVDRYQRFEGICCLNLQDRRESCAWKFASGFFETSVDIYQTKRYDTLWRQQVASEPLYLTIWRQKTVNFRVLSMRTPHLTWLFMAAGSYWFAHSPSPTLPFSISTPYPVRFTLQSWTCLQHFPQMRLNLPTRLQDFTYQKPVILIFTAVF
jgi:hypothetical protein